MRSIWASVLVSTNRELYFYIQTSLHPSHTTAQWFMITRLGSFFLVTAWLKQGSQVRQLIWSLCVSRISPQRRFGGATATLVGYKRVKHEYSEYCVLLEEASSPLQTIFIYYIFGILLLILTVSTHIVGKAEVLQHAESLTETNGQKHI